MIPPGPLFICSLKFAPGLRKEFTLLGDGFARHGVPVSYGLAAPYETDLSESSADSAKRYIITTGSGGWRFLPEIALFVLIFWRLARMSRGLKGRPTYLFYNPHPVQPLVQILLRLVLRARIVTVLHEPSKSIADLKKYGLKGFLYFGVAMVIQSISVQMSDTIVTMSPNGAELFARKFPSRAKDHIAANILLPSQDGKVTPVVATERHHFSFIGSVNQGKNIDDIIETVNAIVAGKVEPVSFLIITASDIAPYLARLSTGWEKYLKVHNKSHISDTEIDEITARSRAVLILHKTASQSGVLPMAYSHGTPVIARDLVAFTQYMNYSGIVLPQEFTPRDLVEACGALSADQQAHCDGAYREFVAHFAAHNFDNLYRRLIIALQTNAESTS